ncbi:uncharacterized protein [Anoplolepis gracilipes]|uniref:uncharacterized protein n=1 Tax=Anoplolepis gracilipes TaxID=354296 RepID=UPI003BA30719
MKNVKNKSSSTESNQEKKVERELLKQNAKLKAYVSRLETIIEKSKSIKLQMLKMTLIQDSEITSSYIPDVQMQLCHKFHQFVGSRCREFNQKLRLVFEINSTEQDVKKNDLYAIEILIDKNGRGKLGKWALPTINVQEILSQHPIDDLNNVKHFLNSCKHYIDSYLCRFKQLEELRDCLFGVTSIDISHNPEITEIELHILRMKDRDTDKFYNVVLYLSYESAGVRPYKLISTADISKQLPSLDRKLNKYFGPFLKKKLSLAFLEISKSQTKFMFPKIIVDQDSSEIFDESNEFSEECSRQFFYRCNIKGQKAKMK